MKNREFTIVDNRLVSIGVVYDLAPELALQQANQTFEGKRPLAVDLYQSEGGRYILHNKRKIAERFSEIVENE